MPKFFVTVRSIEGTSFNNTASPGPLGAIRYLIVPDTAVPLPSHAVGLKEWIKQIVQTFRKVGAATIGDLLMLVHGFNEGIVDVDLQHKKIRAGLDTKFPCTTISFDWPSWTETFAYLEQLDIAKKTAIDFVNAAIKPLLAAQTKDCAVSIHVLCHSMGAFVVREALDHADDGTVTGSDWAVSQLVMIAGDVEASDFVVGNKDMESMLGHSYRLTNYYNQYDEVLQISNVKRLGVEPRVGRVGLPANAPAKTVDINCSEYFDTIRKPDPAANTSWSHSWFYDDAKFMVDLAATLSGKLDRNVVPGRRLDPDGKTLNLRV